MSTPGIFSHFYIHSRLIITPVNLLDPTEEKHPKLTLMPETEESRLGGRKNTRDDTYHDSTVRVIAIYIPYSGGSSNFFYVSTLILKF